jgi:hypothetical protein
VQIATIIGSFCGEQPLAPVWAASRQFVTCHGALWFIIGSDPESLTVRPSAPQDLHLDHASFTNCPVRGDELNLDLKFSIAHDVGAQSGERR